MAVFYSKKMGNFSSKKEKKKMLGCNDLNLMHELKPRSFHFAFAVQRDSTKLREAV